MNRFVLKILLVVVLLSAYSNYAQDTSAAIYIDSTKDSVSNTVAAPTHLAPVKDSSKTGTQKSTTLQKKPVNKPQTLINEALQYDKKFLDAIKQINLLTIIEVLILILIWFGLFRLINRISKSKFFRNLPLAYSKVLVLFRILIGVALFYFVITLLFGSSKEIILFLTLLLVIFIGSASISFWKNFIGGFLISYNPPFETGDFIKVSNYEGKVSEIHWRFTSIITDDSSLVNIPNSIFLDNPVENVNVGQVEHLISLEYDFPADLDVKKISTILIEAAISTPYTFNKNKPEVFLKKVDMLNGLNKFEINLYIFDRRYDNETVNYLNELILTEVKKLKDAN